MTEDHLLLAVHSCLSYLFAGTLPSLKSSPPSTIWRCVIRKKSSHSWRSNTHSILNPFSGFVMETLLCSGYNTHAFCIWSCQEKWLGNRMFPFGASTTTQKPVPPKLTATNYIKFLRSLAVTLRKASISSNLWQRSRILRGSDRDMYHSELPSCCTLSIIWHSKSTQCFRSWISIHPQVRARRYLLLNL